MTARWTGPWGDHRRYRVELSSDDVETALPGGEGLVFAALVDRTGQAVALKMLTALPVDDYGRVAQRGAIFAEVEHPNLMHQVDTFIGPPLTTEESPDARDFGIIYSVADWVPGADLDDAVEGVDARTALGWVGQIAHAVEFLHDVRTDLAPHGIVHRDIKPSNVRITPAGRAVLIDFGVARAFEATDLTSGVGTHLWRAPEVVGGVGEPGPASDAWGIGALAYWVLLREPPPLDSAASARERLVPAARLAGFPDPAGVAHHLSRLLELQPARRPDRLGRWADELDAVVRRSTARRLARPVAAGTMALVATGLAAWSFAPSVARLGRRDSTAQRTAAALVDKSQLLVSKQPAAALALAIEARHRHNDAETDKAVDRAYDAFASSGIVATLRGHADNVSGVAFSGDGSRVVSSSDDHTVRLWDVTAAKEIEPHLTLDSGATSVAMSRGGLVAVGGENGKVWLWDPSVAGSERTVIDAAAAITDVALSPDGSLLAVVVRDGPIEMVETASGSVLWSLPGTYRGVAFGGDSVLVVGHGGRVDVLAPTHERGARQLRLHLRSCPRCDDQRGRHGRRCGWQRWPRTGPRSHIGRRHPVRVTAHERCPRCRAPPRREGPCHGQHGREREGLGCEERSPAGHTPRTCRGRAGGRLLADGVGHSDGGWRQHGAVVAPHRRARGSPPCRPRPGRCTASPTARTDGSWLRRTTRGW